jgi:hypothetical protein
MASNKEYGKDVVKIKELFKAGYEAKAIKELWEKSEKGDENALMHLLALGFVGSDKKRAFRLCELLTKQGNAKGQFYLGTFYQHGLVVKRDCKKTVELWEKSAEQGYDEAQDCLGILYYNGQGVKQDYKKAVELWQKSFEQGNIEACRHLVKAYYDGKGVEKDLSKAFELLEKSNEMEYDIYGDCPQKLGYERYMYKQITENDIRIEWYENKNQSSKV